VVYGKCEIIALHRPGFSKNAISQILGIHHSSVDRWIGLYEETGGLEVIKLPGPQNLTTEEEDFNLACCGIFVIFYLKFGHIFTYFLLFSYPP
jgi:transposase